MLIRNKIQRIRLSSIVFPDAHDISSEICWVFCKPKFEPVKTALWIKLLLSKVL